MSANPINLLLKYPSFRYYLYCESHEQLEDNNNLYFTLLFEFGNKFGQSRKKQAVTMYPLFRATNLVHQWLLFTNFQFFCKPQLKKQTSNDNIAGNGRA